MLLELRVADLGVIGELSLVLGPGMTVVTGETGAGKTLVVTAIDLLVGGRADSAMVRPGATEAVVEARVLLDGGEHVLRRVVPASGRSRAYIDGSLATAASLAELGAQLVDLHGQHDHQSLLRVPAQREALDRYGDVDLEPLHRARTALAELQARIAELGGDPRERARRLDLLRFQVDELTTAAVSPGEDEELEREAALLGDAAGHRGALAAAVAALDVDDGAAAGLAVGSAALADRPAFIEYHDRLRSLLAEAADLSDGLRAELDGWRDDPERAEQVDLRLTLLGQMKRKYGPSLVDVLAFGARAEAELADLEGHDDELERLASAVETAEAEVAEAELAVLRARTTAAPRLGEEVSRILPDLALAGAEVEVEVGSSGAGDDVRYLLRGDPGGPAHPLARTASGGELARVMLALRLVLTTGPDTLVFDEVDAGIGGEAALAVGRSLGRLGASQQVIVVTHLPQVAAFADAHVAVTKRRTAGRSVTTARPVEATERVEELSRMLSGMPDSAAAQENAAALLATAASARARSSP